MSKVLVFGHANPDTDSIASAISYAYLLNQTGHEATAYALGAPSEETQFALDHFGVAAPKVIEKAAEVADADTILALVDHNEAQQSLPDRGNYRIWSVVDHHRIANIETVEPLNYRAETVGCTSTILYKMYNEQGVDIPKDMAGMMLSAVISDTLLMKSPTCTPEDEAAIIALAALAGVDYNTYGLDLLKAGTNLSAKSCEELLDLDAKSFPMGNATVRIAQVNTVDVNDVLTRKAELTELMQKNSEKEGYDLFVLLITNILDSNSTALITGSETAKVESAFGVTVTDGLAELAGVVSRKKQVVPPLTKAFEG
ncbi:MAG: manganese-dependent inorganic pyrophosphatase [Peptococcaceae bacterium]|nr:manganese-dependent inorganic pyrophosphatase [Peptococcaceae bacterium]